MQANSKNNSLGGINLVLDYLSKMVNRTWSPGDLLKELATWFLLAGAAGAQWKRLTRSDRTWLCKDPGGARVLGFCAVGSDTARQHSAINRLCGAASRHRGSTVGQPACRRGGQASGHPSRRCLLSERRNTCFVLLHSRMHVVFL